MSTTNSAGWDAGTDMHPAIGDEPEREHQEVEMVLAPHFRGFAALGTGQYVINHSADLPAELIISIATEAEKAGRTVGDERDNPPGGMLQPDVMAIRIEFTTVAGLDALENQLRYLREVHFPESIARALPQGAPDA
jgi:hypothetical protein